MSLPWHSSFDQISKAPLHLQAHWPDVDYWDSKVLSHGQLASHKNNDGEWFNYVYDDQTDERKILSRSNLEDDLTNLINGKFDKTGGTVNGNLSITSELDTNILKIGGTNVLDGQGKINSVFIPASSVTDTFVRASEAQMLALVAQTGDVCVRNDINKSYILKGSSPSVLADWQELLTPTDAVLSVDGLIGAVDLSTRYSGISHTHSQYFESGDSPTFGDLTATNVNGTTELRAGVNTHLNVKITEDTIQALNNGVPTTLNVNASGGSSVFGGDLSVVGMNISGDVFLNDATGISPEIKFVTTSGIMGIDMFGNDLRIIDRTNSLVRATIDRNTGNVETAGSLTATNLAIDVEGHGGSYGKLETWADTSANTALSIGRTVSAASRVDLRYNEAGQENFYIDLLYTGTPTFNVAHRGVVKMSVDSSGTLTANGITVNGASTFTDLVATGNVGIGTGSNTVERRVHVQGSGGTIAAKIEATDGNQSSLDLKNSEGEFRLINDGGELSVFDQTDNTERLRINTGGNVGIGTTSPSAKLHSKATGNWAGTFESTGSSRDIVAIRGSTTTTDSTIGASGNTLVFGSDGSERMRIDASGNVGIGTSSPSSALDVDGNINSTSFGLSTSPTGVRHERLPENTFYEQLVSDGSDVQLILRRGSNTPSMMGTKSNGTFVLFTGDPDPSLATLAMTIDSSQNTTFTGTITASTVTVDNDTNVGGEKALITQTVEDTDTSRVYCLIPDNQVPASMKIKNIYCENALTGASVSVTLYKEYTATTVVDDESDITTTDGLYYKVGTGSIAVNVGVTMRVN